MPDGFAQFSGAKSHQQLQIRTLEAEKKDLKEVVHFLLFVVVVTFLFNPARMDLTFRFDLSLFFCVCDLLQP